MDRREPGNRGGRFAAILGRRDRGPKPAGSLPKKGTKLSEISAYPTPIQPRPRVSRTAQEIIVERLRSRVLSGDLQPGARILQAEIAVQMNTSTTPVREALWELAGAGLLDVDPHRGVIVHVPTRAELVDIYELRLLLEPLAISAAVDNITEDELRRAEQITQRMRAADLGQVVLANAEFHELLAAASRRPHLIEILTRLNNVAMIYVVSNLYRVPGRVQIAIDEHQELIAACRQHDKERAVSLIATHLQASLTLWQESFARQERT
ncbi:MAG: GntR family transcriptional regulator [Actinomycetota bacterium]